MLFLRIITFIEFFLSTINISSAVEKANDLLSDEFETKLKISYEIDLCRLSSNKNSDKEDEQNIEYSLLAQYTSSINKVFPLNRENSRQKAQCVAGFSAKEGYKESHVIVNSFSAYKKKLEDDLIFQFKYFRDMHFPSFDSNKNLVIDWISNKSTTTSNDKFFRRKSDVENGHSEPKFISDINDVWKTSPDIILNLFMPPDSSATATMSGIELHGSFDMCDKCLTYLKTFREKHQKGQESIAYALRDKLKSLKIKFNEKKISDSFLVIYHSQFPYKKYATYHAEDQESWYNAFEYYPVYGSPRQDVFGNDAFNDTHILRQQDSIFTKKDTIYGHIHQLSGKNANYDTQKKAFVFK